MKLGGMCDTASGMGCSFQGCGKKVCVEMSAGKRGEGVEAGNNFCFFFLRNIKKVCNF